MKEQVAVQKILLNKYEEMRTRNPNFSRRAYSKRLGISPGAMSELFSGQRQVSVKLAERIADRLALDPQERSELFSLFPKKIQRTKKDDIKTDEVDPSYLQLSADQFRVIGDWYHFAILTLMRTKNFKSDPNWIAKRLGLPPTTVQAALERLKRLTLIKEDEKGRLTRSRIRYRTPDDVANSSIRRAHAFSLEKAREALDTLTVEQRDFTSLMLSISPEKLARAKELVRQFQDQLSAELETSPGQEVYQLCIQLFPLTNLQGDEE